MMAPLSLKSYSCIYFIRTSAYRQMKRSKHREEQMILRMWILRMWSWKHTVGEGKSQRFRPNGHENWSVGETVGTGVR